MNTDDYNNCVDKNADAVYRFLLKNLRNSDSARDILQDAFERLWKNRNNVNNESSKSYLFTSAYHIMIDSVRKNKKNSSDDILENISQNAFNQYSDVKEIIDAAVCKLPQEQRSVILLRDYEGYSYDEISEITGLSLSAVKVEIFRGRNFLKKCLETADIFSHNDLEEQA